MCKPIFFLLSSLFFVSAASAGLTYEQAKAVCEKDGSELVSTVLLLEIMRQVGDEVPEDWYWSGDLDPECNPKSCHFQVHSTQIIKRSAADESRAAKGTFCYDRIKFQLRLVSRSGRPHIIKQW